MSKEPFESRPEDETREPVEPEATESDAETAELESRGAAAESKAEDTMEYWKDRYLRQLAETQNFRKRMERDREGHRRFAEERLARDLLPILDALDLASAADGDAQNIREGVKLALHNMVAVLKERGLEKIQAQGESFDPNVHEAVATVPHPELDPWTVIEELSCGYVFHGRVLRPSRVHVAVRPPEPAPESEDAAGDAGGAD